MFSRIEAEAAVHEMSDWVGDDPNHPVFQAAVLLLLGLGRRKHLVDLVKVSKYPKPFVKECLVNLKQARIWQGEAKLTYANWSDQPLEFLLDTMTAAGIIERVPPNSYRLTESYQRSSKPPRR